MLFSLQTSEQHTAIDLATSSDLSLFFLLVSPDRCRLCNKIAKWNLSRSSKGMNKEIVSE